jgi:cobalt-zinc-cadmium resistance protein CzcA
VVIGGVLSSTVLTLLLLPVLYEWAHRARVRGVSKNIL